MSLFRRLLKTVHPEGIPGPAAKLYDALSRSNIFHQHYELVAQDIASYCRQGRLLDIGTGPGRLLIELHRAAPQLGLTGSDISPAMVAQGRKNVAAAGLAGEIDILEAGADRLPFGDASFDVVVSTGSLHHWKDIAGGLNECFRVLRDGGVALMYDLVTKLPPDVAAAGRRQFGKYRMILLWLHSFEEPFYTQQQMLELAATSRFGRGEVRFVGVLCCLILRKPPAA